MQGGGWGSGTCATVAQTDSQHLYQPTAEMRHSTAAATITLSQFFQIEQWEVRVYTEYIEQHAFLKSTLQISLLTMVMK